jgi:hypothetical protein
VHLAGRMHDRSAERFADPLQPQAHPEHRHAEAVGVANDVHHRAGVGRPAGTWADQNAVERAQPCASSDGSSLRTTSTRTSGSAPKRWARFHVNES